MPVELYTVPPFWRASVAEFYRRAFPIGLDLDIKITSWQRTRSRNAATDGKPMSQHLVATAWDVAGPDQDVYAARARRAGLVVVLYPDRSHVHVQLYPAGTIPTEVYRRVAIA